MKTQAQETLKVCNTHVVPYLASMHRTLLGTMITTWYIVGVGMFIITTYVVVLVSNMVTMGGG
jgi:hypothetical protein